MKDRRVAQVSVKSRLKDKRLQSARARKYYEEFQVGQRSKMMRKKTKEELVSLLNNYIAIKVCTKAIKQVRLHLDSNQGRQIAGLMLYH